jgi:hypothetical protein
VCLFGESNRIIRGGTGKPTWPQRGFAHARAAVFKRGEPDGHDPNPDDLHVGKVKRAERHVEAC